MPHLISFYLVWCAQLEVVLKQEWCVVGLGPLVLGMVQLLNDWFFTLTLYKYRFYFFCLKVYHN